MVQLFRLASPGSGSGFSQLLPAEGGDKLPLSGASTLQLRIERACAGELSEREAGGDVALALAVGDQTQGWQVAPGRLERVDAPRFDLPVTLPPDWETAPVGVVMLVNVSKPDHTLHGLCDLMVTDAGFDDLLQPLDEASRQRLLASEGPGLPRLACALALSQAQGKRAYASDFVQQEHALVQGRVVVRRAEGGPPQTGTLLLETGPRGAPPVAMAPGSLRLLKPAYSLCKGRQGLQFVEDLPHVVVTVTAE